jgi:hypothetical protein
MQDQRAQELAARFATLNQEVIAFVESCPAATWQAICPGEQRTVGVVAHHIAAAHALITQAIELVATGQPLPPVTTEVLDHLNATHAVAHATCTQREVADLLRANGAATGDLLGGLSEEQLDRMAHNDLLGMRLSTQQIVEHVLLGHPMQHFAALRSAAEPAPG